MHKHPGDLHKALTANPTALVPGRTLLLWTATVLHVGRGWRAGDDSSTPHSPDSGMAGGSAGASSELPTWSGGRDTEAMAQSVNMGADDDE
jgi:hypothetical protein